MIIDGKRLKGAWLMKWKGRQDYVLYVPCEERANMVRGIGPCAQVDTKEDPRAERFHYCSIVSQPVFFDESYIPWGDCPHTGGDTFTPSSWKQLPKAWRQAFRDYLDLPPPKSGKE